MATDSDPITPDEIDGTHKCPAPECEVRLEFHIFACKAHWATMPHGLKSKIVRTWMNGGMDSYLHAHEEGVKWLSENT